MAHPLAFFMFETLDAQGLMHAFLWSCTLKGGSICIVLLDRLSCEDPRINLSTTHSASSFLLTSAMRNLGRSTVYTACDS